MIVSRPAAGAHNSTHGVPAPSTPHVPQRRLPELGHGPHRLDRALRLSVQRPAPGIVVVTMDGDIDLSAAPRIAELVQQRLTAARLNSLVLDLTHVSFINSHGLELLLHTQRRADYRNITLFVIPGARCVRRLLHLTEATECLHYRDTVAEAVAEARRP